MTITLPPELAKRLTERAIGTGRTPEEIALVGVEREVVRPTEPTSGESLVARLRAVAIPVEVLPGTTFSREEIYD